MLLPCKYMDRLIYVGPLLCPYSLTNLVSRCAWCLIHKFKLVLTFLFLFFTIFLRNYLTYITSHNFKEMSFFFTRLQKKNEVITSADFFLFNLA